MDISKIEASTRTIDISHPGTGEFLGLSIDIVDMTDDRVRAAERRGRNKVLSKGAKKISAEMLDKTADDILVAAVVGWTWGKNEKGEDANFEGEKLPFNPKNVIKVVTALPFIREQIDDELGNISDFYQG